MKPRLEADPDAVALVRRKGGRIFLWIDGAGVKHISTHPPRRRVVFDVLQAEEFALHVDREIAAPEVWTVVRRRLSLVGVDVLWNGEKGPAVEGPGSG